MSTPAHFNHIRSLILVTGLSGAGKSTAMDLLSDSGYYVVDNLPVPLLEQFLAFSITQEDRYHNTALLLAVDSQDNRTQLLKFLETATPRSHLKVIFLDADNRSILRRYSETRRPHPGFDPLKDKTLEDTISRERARLQPIKERADLVIDTSTFNIHALKRELREFLLRASGEGSNRALRVNFLSFGFKNGLPLDCDLVVDVRFLRNPHFVEELRERTGLEKEVADYIFASPDAGEFVDKYSTLLEFLLPRYQFEGKAYVNIGVGCTGGKHRSVAIAEALSKRIDSGAFNVSVKHRDLPKSEIPALLSNTNHK